MAPDQHLPTFLSAGCPGLIRLVTGSRPGEAWRCHEPGCSYLKLEGPDMIPETSRDFTLPGLLITLEVRMINLHCTAGDGDRSLMPWGSGCGG